MRTNIEIDDALMARAVELSGLPTKKAVVEQALKLLVDSLRQWQAIKAIRGLGWEGDLDESRSGRFRFWSTVRSGSTTSATGTRLASDS